MKRINLAIITIFLCLPIFAQSPAANQVQINKRNFTIGTNTYDTDYNLIFNQWYKGHKNAEEAKQGEDLSWVNDFNRTYTLGFAEGNLAIGGNEIDSVKIISFTRSGGRRNSFGDIGMLSINQQLVYDSKSGKLIGAQFDLDTYNAYFNVKTDFFDMPEFAFPLKVSVKNTAVSNISVSSGLASYKIVYEYTSNAGSTSAGVKESIYHVNSEIAKKLKEADDYAKNVKNDIPSLLGELHNVRELNNVGFINITHRLTIDLNVFSRQDGGSTVVASLKKGAAIQVLEYGDYASWNGITAKWAKVQTNDNKTGWLFSGYLEEVNK
jgi:hypothetical protein